MTSAEPETTQVKAAASKTPAKKAPAKKAPATQAAAKKVATAKTTAAKTATAKTAAAKTTTAKTAGKTTTAKTAAKTTAAAKGGTKTTSTRPSAAKKTAATATPTKAAAEKAATSLEVVVEPTPKASLDASTPAPRTADAARLAAAKNTASRKPATSRQAGTSRAAGAKAAASTSPAEKSTTARSTSAKTSAAKAAAVKTAAAKTAAAKSTARTASAKTAAARTAAAKAAAAKAAAEKAAVEEAAQAKAADEISPATETAPLKGEVSASAGAVPDAVETPAESSHDADDAVDAVDLDTRSTDDQDQAQPAPADGAQETGALMGAVDADIVVVEPEAAAASTAVPAPADATEPAPAAEAPAAESVDVADPVTSTEPPLDGEESVDDEPRTEAIRIRGLVKQFGDNRAVDGIDLSVPAASFYGIVGPNGAGKTTTLSIVAGLLRADEGSVVICGIDQATDPLAAKRVMGVLPDRLRTFDRLTGRQLLYYYGLLRGLAADVIEKRAADLARAFDLGDALNRVVSDYSAGMTKKIMLAGAMIHSPRVLVLDEPFESVDPVSSAVILDILRAYVAHGGTVILSSHGMDLVERVCSRVAIIVNGEVLAEGTIDEVRAGQTLESRFVELAGSSGEVEGLEWLHTFSD